MGYLQIGLEQIELLWGKVEFLPPWMMGHVLERYLLEYRRQLQ